MSVRVRAGEAKKLTLRQVLSAGQPKSPSIGTLVNRLGKEDPSLVMTEVWGDLDDWKKDVQELIRKACSMKKDAIIRIFVAAVVSDYSLVWNWKEKTLSLMHKRVLPVQEWSFKDIYDSQEDPAKGLNIQSNDVAIELETVYNTLVGLLRLAIGPLNLVWMSLGSTKKDWVDKHMPMVANDDLWENVFELRLHMQTGYAIPKFEWLPNADDPLGKGQLRFHREFRRSKIIGWFTVSGPHTKQLMLEWMFEKLSMFFDDPSTIDLKIVYPSLPPAPAAGSDPKAVEKANTGGSDTDTASSSSSSQPPSPSNKGISLGDVKVETE